MPSISATINSLLGCIEISATFEDIAATTGSGTVSVETIEIKRRGTRIAFASDTMIDAKHTFSIKDYSAIPGIIYTYTAIGIYTDNQKITVTRNIDYLLNDAFLFDKESNLRIRYDPDVTSFKIIVDDAITKTLGSRYPFARRNGDTYYRQFNIGGLISLEGEQGSFTRIESEPIPLWNTGLPSSFTNADEYGKMIIKERAYRDLVLDFLHDGKVKLFKSNTEGLIPVRLTNISLTPNKTLGRNIWTFSAQATEMEMPSYSWIFPPQQQEEDNI